MHFVDHVNFRVREGTIENLGGLISIVICGELFEMRVAGDSAIMGAAFC
jgi:hypothetical protein